MARGGVRAGAGRPKGSVQKAPRADKVSFAELARQHAPAALQVLVQIMQTGVSEAARVSAATAIMDRAYGKVPVQEPDADGEATSLTINLRTAAPVGDVRVTRSDA